MRQYRETYYCWYISYSMLKLHKMSDNSLSVCKVCRSQIGKYIICMWLINTCKILDENILINLQVVKVRVIRKIWVSC